MKVLVVEDEPEVVEAIVLCLTMPWPDVTLIATNSGEVAIEVAHWLTPDTILLDLQLDDLYGLQALQQIRGFSDAPLVVLTANNQETSRQRALQIGADDYLVKPFTHIDLLGSMKAVLSKAHLWAPSSVIRGQQNEGLVVNLPGRQISRHGITIDLTPPEWQLLAAMIQGEDGAVPRTALGKNNSAVGRMTRSAAEEAFQSLSTKLGGAGSNARLLLSRSDKAYQIVPAY